MTAAIPCVCPDCGPVQVTTGVLLILTGTLLSESWRCPGCGAWITRGCDDMRRSSLVVRGSRTLTVVSNDHDGVPLNEDEFLAFGREIEACADAGELTLEVAVEPTSKPFGLRRVPPK